MPVQSIVVLKNVTMGDAGRVKGSAKTLTETFPTAAAGAQTPAALVLNLVGLTVPANAVQLLFVHVVDSTFAGPVAAKYKNRPPAIGFG